MRSFFYAGFLIITLFWVSHIQAQFVLGPENFMYGKETPGYFAESVHQIAFVHQDRIVVSYSMLYNGSSYGRQYYTFDKNTGVLVSNLPVKKALKKLIKKGSSISDYCLHKSSEGIFVFFEVVESIKGVGKSGTLCVIGLNDNYEPSTELTPLISYMTVSYQKGNTYLFQFLLYKETIKFSADQNEAYFISNSEAGEVQLNIVYFPEMQFESILLDDGLPEDKRSYLHLSSFDVLGGRYLVMNYSKNKKEFENDTLDMYYGLAHPTGVFCADLTLKKTTVLEGDLIPFESDELNDRKIDDSRSYCFGSSYAKEVKSLSELFEVVGNFEKEILTNFDGGTGKLVADIYLDGGIYYLLFKGSSDKYLRIGRYSK